MKAHAENFKQCEEDSPWKYKLSDWLAVLKRTWKEASHDNVSVIAAGVAFFSLLAVFPLITAALSTVSYFVDQKMCKASQVTLRNSCRRKHLGF